MPQLFNNQGRPIALGSRIAQGGEGGVYEVRDQSRFVAKLYHSNVSKEKTAKLLLMVSLQTERILKLAAWPVDTLHEKPGGRLTGFLMPRITEHKDIHILYGVKSRQIDFPEARWPFLIQAATNLARAFDVIHEHGHVIGDVNHGGIVVSKKATVTLVDCDSFQISANGQCFLCEVGVATHTPPELQGQRFHGVIRTTNHDAFGLAVIIFQLLFMGRHPFSGAFLGSGEMPLEKAIKEHRFAYGARAGLLQMKQPPGTLSLEAVSQPIAKLFERAFLSDTMRPQAREWIQALGELSGNLKKCSNNSGHYFLKTLASCPWCEVEVRSGVLIFPPVVIFGAWQNQGAFNIAATWTQITLIRPPGPPPALPAKSSRNVTVSLAARQMRRVRLLRSMVAGGLLIAVSALLLALPISAEATAWLIVVSGIVAFTFAKSGATEVRRGLEVTKREAERKWRDIEQRWRTSAGDQSFHAKLRELETLKSELDALSNVRLRKLQHLEATVRERQLNNFLDRYRIDMANISGIGPSRRVTLRSFGIETAADVNMHAILAVPGFGPAYTSKLLTWRSMIEQRFVFDPARGVDPTDREAVEREIASTRARLEQELQSGPGRLRQISQQIHATRQTMQMTMQEALKALAQAESDLSTGSSSALTLAPIFSILGIALILIIPLKSKFSNPGSRDRRYTVTPSVTPTPLSTPQPTPSPMIDAAKTLYDQGVGFTKAGQYAEAVKAYQQAVSLKPDYAEAYHELGYAHYKLGNYEDAITSLKQALALTPKNAETYRNLGLSYKALGRWSDASGAFRKAIEIKPSHPVTYYNLGLVYKEMKDNDSAITAYKAAIQLKPDYAAAHYELGLLYVAVGDQGAAMGEYTTLVPLNQKLADRLYAVINE